MISLTKLTLNCHLPFPTCKYKQLSSKLPPISMSSSTQDPIRKEPTKSRKTIRTPKSNITINTSLSLSSNSNSSALNQAIRADPRIWALCGMGYWVQGFRCFPWLGLNFHFAHEIGLSPASLQLVQNTANLPMVAKPLFGVLSDAVYIGKARRLPYISIGVFLQLLSWGTLSIIPITGDTFPTQMTCILLSNLGASITEVVSDALVTEFSRTKKSGELQSYAFIALAAGAMLGNFSGGYVLLKTHEPKLMFFTFSLLLAMQLGHSLTTRETLENHLPVVKRSSVSDNLRTQFSNLVSAISKERIIYPLSWIISSIAVVPLLSGSMFCFQTQQLKLDPSIIGLSKVIGQITVLSATMIYKRFLKRIPFRRLAIGIQVLYSLALLSDLFLVKQINLLLGISNETYVLCLSALAEAIAQFKILPFSVLLSSLCPAGSEGSLFAFFASGICLSSILSGILGVGMSAVIGVTGGDYSSLPLGIVVQSLAALLPLCWIYLLPSTWNGRENIVKTR